MGFFSDLKEDLSQAVNELTPEGELEANLVGDELPKDAELMQEGDITPEALSEMLDMVEAISAENGLELPEEELPDAGETEPEMELPDAEMSELPEMSEPEAEFSDLAMEIRETELPEYELPDMPELATEFSDMTMEEQEAELPESELSDMPEIETEISDLAVEAQGMEAELSYEESEDIENYDMEMAADDETAGEPMEEEMESESILEPTAEEYEPLKENEGEENSMEDMMSIESKVVSDETAVVTEGMSITGDITSGGSLELIGNVVGNIEILGKLNITGGIQGNSKAAEIYAEGARINGEVVSQGSVKIGQSSVVIGNISANSAVIAGAVKGDIDVHGPVILDTTAIVMGNIKSKSVQINNGAVIEGMCSQCYADVNPTSFFDEINKKSKKKEK